ncbi:DNA-binding response regulator, OmpR family, contains REC and winged-helix (wHTH) domain [Sporobacter termitidis DSM 10068]|uniref:Stage 0 sporulation protein A homolog n=1 Tax=Sporobacter termitidis DSM 10068 TaxID=1123282 RepID=A0A1M5W5S9_9FIRM|nr:response regulator transcription factor [Sporobacter termitidis]SHH82825.1 DNA-binding response regulator, OmpR family, contains REC and winged-helix (wHTH) domain [Sporobacter termitidis DSM 10068]
MAKIMVVEDEAAIADLILVNLRLVGYTGISVDRGNEVMNSIELHKPDLIILDVMLPGKDGFSLMREIEPLQIPVIFLTAKEELNDKITGLKLGADDYIVKPFAIIELLTRIETVLKRYKVDGNTFVLDNLEVNLDAHTVLIDNQPIELTTKEFMLLEILIRNKNIALSREKLLELVWGYDYMGETRTVDVHIQRLRKKLGLDDKIKTVFKMGYRLEVPR